MEIHAHIQAQRLHAGDAFRHRVKRLGTVKPAQRAGGVHLDGLEALCAAVFGLVRDFAGRIAADPGIDADMVAHFPAQKLPDGKAQALAFDIPKRLVETRQGRHQDRAAAIKPKAIGGLPNILDPGGLCANKAVTQRREGAFNRLRMAFETGFAPAGYSILGLHTHEEPARRHAECFDLDGGSFIPCRASLAGRAGWWRAPLAILEMESPVPASSISIASSAIERICDLTSYRLMIP